MSKEWIYIQLGELCSKITYGFTNPMPNSQGKDDPYLVTAKDIKNGKINYATARRTTGDAFSTLLTEKSRPHKGDVLLTKDGSIGRLAICDRDDICINQSVARLQMNGRANSEFIKYLLESPHYQRKMEGDSDGTTIKHIYITRLDKMDVPFPPYKEQKAIAHILGTLDEKIELNRKNNAILEGIAKTLFKSWFIDFDPVRAKAEDRSTGLPAEISDLFPSTFENSELGFIPEGWEISKLGDLVFPCGESIKSSKEITTQPYVPIDCITSKSLTLKEYKPGSEAKSSLIRFRKGDILFGAMRPYFHKVCIAPFDGITRSTCIPLRQIEASFHAFSTLIVSNKETIEYATQNSTGSTIPYIKWKDNLENMKIIKPPKPISKCFDNIIVPILEKFCSSIFIQKNLIEIRDALLPKLISGELRIPDAEKMIEEVGI